MQHDDALIYVVDDDEAVRDSLTMLLRAVGLPGQAFSSAATFLENYDPEQHGCLVADIRMPGMSGLELQDELNRRGAPIPLVFITGHGDVPMAVDAMKSGALDFIEKPFRDQDLLDRVHQALSWDKERRSEKLKTLAIRERLVTLTPRETQVMELVVQGQANKVIAMDLGVSQRTVEIHRARVMEKMGVRSVAKLVLAVEAAKA
jgi:two-component system response regulator FixJ